MDPTQVEPRRGHVAHEFSANGRAFSLPPFYGRASLVNAQNETNRRTRELSSSTQIGHRFQRLLASEVQTVFLIVYSACIASILVQAAAAAAAPAALNFGRITNI